jgi:hypothetical protein
VWVILLYTRLCAYAGGICPLSRRILLQMLRDTAADCEPLTRCTRLFAIQIKSVVRASLLHTSLYAGVHFFCYQQGYRKQTLYSWDNPVLYHYKHQAWEVYHRKHLRRASPASKPFVGGDVNVSMPSNRWWKESTFCKGADYTINHHTLCALSYRVAGPNCTWFCATHSCSFSHPYIKSSTCPPHVCSPIHPIHPATHTRVRSPIRA